MGRIRTIKPEFPQSESIGRLSRDARLLFILLWTLVDDDGRARAASRALASLLYPHDDDVPSLINGWLEELERAGKIRRYTSDGSQYLDIPNWLEHQRIDHPSKSKLPAYSPSPRELSRTLAPDLDLERTKKDTDAKASAAAGRRNPDGPNPDDGAAADVRTRLFTTGLRLLAEITGRTEDSSRSLIGRWLKLTADEAVHVLAAIEDAARNRVADPTAWITATLKSRSGNGANRQDGQRVSPILAALERHSERINRPDKISDDLRPSPPRLLQNG